MSLKYRKNRINKLHSTLGLKKNHDLMVSYQIPKDNFNRLKEAVKLYISKALHIPFEQSDHKFIKILESVRNNRINVTPNGAVVPKREFHLEYNMVLREWCSIIDKLVEPNKKILSRFRKTPNIRIKYSKEFKDNIKRGLNTSLPHSDAWVEGPWGMNCYLPILGDTIRNTLAFYEPNNFKEEYLKNSESYVEMAWVLKNYSKIKLIPKRGYVHISDYALIHNSNRQANAGTRVSIDTSIFVGDHLPHKDRLKEYVNQIPKIGINEFVDAGQYESKKFAEKISTFSHYTSKVLKHIKF
jgi:hypothetical protein